MHLRSNGFTTERYYLLNIRSSALKVTVPCQNATAVGLRGLVCKDEMDRILIFLAQAGGQQQCRLERALSRAHGQDEGGHADGSRRSAEEPAGAASREELSVRERKTLERARYLLVNEMAQAKQCDENAIEDW